MVDLRQAARVIGRGAVGGLEVLLAMAVLGNFWLFADLPSGPGAPEQAGTFTWAFLFVWAVTAISLVAVVLGHLLVNGYQRWARSGAPRLRRPAGRLGLELALGAGFGWLVSPLGAGEGSLVLLAPAGLAWSVLIHYAVDAVRFGLNASGTARDA